jgi:hypothetical protein
MVFHSPNRSKSVITAHTLSAGAGREALTETSGMTAPLRRGHAKGGRSDTGFREANQNLTNHQ